MQQSARDRGTSASAQTVRRILTFSSAFPSSVQPIHGVFVKERVRHVAQLPQCEVRVVSPVPYFPPIRWFPRWYALSQISRAEMIDGLPVTRPRYLLLPKFGKYFHPRSMAMAARPAVARIQRDFDFDVIDAHFAYPDGVAAMYLARHFNKPFVITGRGADILCCPAERPLGKSIRQALAEATKLVAVSSEIAQAMQRLGASPDKITVIPNGVDTQKFHPLPQSAARGELNLPAGCPLVLSVGYLLELKGFHILADAMPEVRRHFPDAQLAIVGGTARWGLDYTAQIKQHIEAAGAGDYVRLVGGRPPEELPKWYAAADVFALATSREGSPNAMMEALACGLPAVATPVGEIPRLLADPRMGMLLPERTPRAAAQGIIAALSKTWDRPAIAKIQEQHSWHVTAERVKQVLDSAIADYHR